MLKSDLSTSLAAKHSDIPGHSVKEAVDKIIESMTVALQGGGRVEIRGFGTFSIRELAEKKGRNPKSGIDVTVGERVKAHFKPGKELKERVDASRTF